MVRFEGDKTPLVGRAVRLNGSVSVHTRPTRRHASAGNNLIASRPRRPAKLHPNPPSLGLTRAFQYAGARAVLASLWSVDDFQTMRLMRRFYAELRAGTSQDKALQAAQLELLRSKSASAPYYWAGFMLFGDAR